MGGIRFGENGYVVDVVLYGIYSIMATPLPLKQRFKDGIIDSLKFMKLNPGNLEETPVEIMVRLKEYMKSKGQSSANEVKPHEACIAGIFESRGFKLATRNVVPKDDGLFYWYQAGGSQTGGDFLLFWVLGGKKLSHVYFDAKHTNTEVFFLNDGWFNEDTIYIVSLSKSNGRGRGRKNVCFIGMGQDIPTERDSLIMQSYNGIKRELNSKRKTEAPDFLSIYVRFANQYSTKQFTDDFIEDRFKKTVSWLLPADE